jgi:hypothetical protein
MELGSLSCILRVPPTSCKPGKRELEVKTAEKQRAAEGKPEL